MSVDVERFLASEADFALRIQRSDLPGFWSKRLQVPEGVVALVQGEGGQAEVLEAGGESDDLKSALLVKSKAKLSLELSAGRSQDGLEFTLKLSLHLSPRPKSVELVQLERAFLGSTGELASLTDLTEHFRPYLRDAVRFFVSERNADELATQDQAQALEAHLQEKLRKALFETGLELSDMRHPEFLSDAFEAKQEAVSAASEQSAAIERERAVVEAKKQLDMEALLADIEVQDEADRARKERRLERYEQLRSGMGDDDRKALVMLIEDDQQRAKLIRELIEQDMSPQQRAGVAINDMESRVEERLRELQQKLAQLGSGVLQRGEEDPRTRRVLCVVGKRVLAFDPKTNLHPEVPKEVYDTEEGGLGYLRSVCQERIEGEDFLLMGAQRGVYRVKGSIRTEFHFPVEPKGKGGANAVAYFDGRLYATHSEVGLVEWSFKEGIGRQLCRHDLEQAGSVRGAQIHQGKLFFSAGKEVFSIDVAKGEETPVRYKGSDDSVTSFTLAGEELVAGNRGGKLYRWRLDDPNSPEDFKVKKQNPIFMLRHTTIAGQDFFVMGSKEFTVTAAEPRKDVFREYQAREEVRWVDAAGDYIFGVSRSGYKVFCWDTLVQNEPKLTIRVSDKVQDLFVVREA